MFLIIFFILLFLNNNYKKFILKNLNSIVFILFIAIIYYLELIFFHNRNIYYSDAEHYWDLYLQRDFSSYEFVAVSFIYLSNLFGLINSPFFLIINNICIYTYIVYIINLILLVEYNINDLKDINNFLFLNGTIIYMYIRSLKDIYFVFLIILLLGLYFFKKKGFFITVVYFLYSIFLYTILKSLRPWSYIYIFILYIIDVLIYTNKNVKLRVLLYFLVLVTILLNFNSISYFVNYNLKILQYFNENIAGNTTFTKINSLTGFLKAYIVFLFGPGPGRIINFKNNFLYYTYTGNVLLFFGNLMFYFYIVKFFTDFILFKKYKTIIYNPFFIFAFIFITVYVIAYNGSVESRLRADFYILFIPLASLINRNELKKVKIYLILAITFLLSTILLFVR